jgi:hypothetical protein
MRDISSTAPSLGDGIDSILAPASHFLVTHMWCSTCQQDVPAVQHPLLGQTVCARCQQKLSAARPTYASSVADNGIALDDPIAVAVATADPPAQWEDWETRQRARHLGRMLRRPGIDSGPQSSKSFGTARRFDPPQQFFMDLAELTAPAVHAPTHFTQAMRPLRRRAERSQVAAWMLVVLGALALAGGIGAIGWCLGENRTEYWNLALGLTLTGQGVLIFGLVLVVSRLWQNSRSATGKLQDAHSRLVELQRTAEVLSATRTGGAPAFYAELVRGASPQMLLSNLKGQLDQLATRLGGDLSS